VYCSTVDSSQLASFQVPSPIIQPVVRDVRNTSILSAPVIDLSESLIAIRTNPTFSSQCIAQTAKDLTGFKQSSRDSLKGSFHARALAASCYGPSTGPGTGPDTGPCT
jgi:hypothetical protein